MSDPDIEVGPLKIWIYGRERPDAQDTDDYNWLNATAVCRTVRVDGPFLRVEEIRYLAQSCRDILAGEKTIALETIEANLKLSMSAKDNLGHFEVRLMLTPDHMFERHEYWYEIDQSFLPAIIRQCERVLAAYPARGKHL